MRTMASRGLRPATGRQSRNGNGQGSRPGTSRITAANPYRATQYRPGTGRSSGRHGRKPKSALMGGLSIGGFVLYWVFAFAAMATAVDAVNTMGSGAAPTTGQLAGIGVLALLALISTLVGLALGIAGVAMRSSSKPVAIVGLVLNGGLLLVSLVLTLGKN